MREIQLSDIVRLSASYNYRSLIMLRGIEKIYTDDEIIEKPVINRLTI